MSTVPGADAWRDAGLVPVGPDEPRRLGDPDAASDEPSTDPEDYAPDFPRGDLDDRADEADVVDQDTEVPADDDVDDD
ncbi:MAG TPA: hypothetical protein VGC04_14510 [Cellulomonas sp.]